VGLTQVSTEVDLDDAVDALEKVRATLERGRITPATGELIDLIDCVLGDRPCPN
jgi:hypothetical protein